MKPIVTIATAFFFTVSCIAAFSTPVLAGAQQERMKACNEEARKKDLHGEERKTFMSSCLSTQVSGSENKAPSDKVVSQQEKMKECNREAKDKNLKGDERRRFMSGCLKG
jgi:hypothetical protein